MKRWLYIIGIVLAVLLVIVIALPFFLNVNSFRPRVESELSNALGRQVTVGNLSLSILFGSLGADNIVIADDPAFSKSPFITAKSLRVGVELMPLIFSKQLNVTGIKVVQPQISLLKSARGTWNLSSIGNSTAKKGPEKESSGTAPTNFSVAKLNIDDGRLTIGKAHSSAKPLVCDKVNIEIKNFSFNSQFPFKLTTNLPGGGDAKITGKAGPINSEDAAKTPFETAVKVNDMNIAGLEPIMGESGFGGLASFDGTLNSDGSRAKAVGVFTGAKLKLSAKGTPAPKTVVVKHTVDLDLDKQSGAITQGDVSIGSAQAHLTGTFRTENDTQVLNLKLNAPNMPVDELQAMLPSLGIVLPSGSQLKGGTVSAELGITGPIDKMVITGPLRMANTKLTGFDMGAKLGALAAFAGKAVSNPDTAIENASLNAHVAPEGTRADNINLTVPAIGVITGAGTVSPAGALNFKMLADLRGGVVGEVSKMASLGQNKNGIPFAIQGTTSNPKFIPDVGGVVGGMATGALQQMLSGKGMKGNPADALGGLLGKKKPH